ncbi:MAG: aldose epimerase family protein [Candidatus Coproplasma sp.]
MIYSISNGNIQLEINDFGARIHALKVNGTDIVLGYNSDEEYIKSGTYCGATIGRFGNRIAKGKFELGGKEYQLNCNDGVNHLHGGNVGFDKKVFTVTEQTNDSITFEYVSADGEENYPGELKLTVKFTINNNSLLIDFTAVSDKDTLWNPTNHAYFNLDGEGSGDCRENILQINADKITLVDGGLIPTGEVALVSKTAFDFRVAKPIIRDFTDVCLKATNGYDHNFILNGEHAAHVESAKTGIAMDVYTDMPCMQLYTGGAIKPSVGKTINYKPWSGFCLEPQYCPNSVNLQGFEKPVIKAGQTASHYIRYEFK